MEERSDDARVEPLLAALDGAGGGRSGSGGRLAWKLLCAALVFLALLVLVLKQAY